MTKSAEVQSLQYLGSTSDRRERYVDFGCPYRGDAKMAGGLATPLQTSSKAKTSHWLFDVRIECIGDVHLEAIDGL